MNTISGINSNNAKIQVNTYITLYMRLFSVIQLFIYLCTVAFAEVNTVDTNAQIAQDRTHDAVQRSHAFIGSWGEGSRACRS